jgi:C-terminal processing protease CtpA/Prc
MLLTDELSASAAEMFAAVMQDEKRALLYGMRTDGAGGAVFGFNVGTYMEAGATLAQTRMVRRNLVDSGGEYPMADYVENIGVRPDKVDDYMTVENLMSKGKPSVNGFVTAMVEYIQAKK